MSAIRRVGRACRTRERSSRLPARELSGAPGCSLSRASAAGGGGAAGRRSAVEARRWLDDIVVTGKARDRVLHKLRRQYGKPQGKVGKLDRYARRRGAQVMEVLVDPDVGAVVEENVADAEGLKAHVTHRYEQVGAGVYVKRATRMETRGRGGQRLVVEAALSNVRIETRGGK